MEENQSFLELQVDQEASANITEASRWGKLLATMVLVAFGLMFLMFILMWDRFCICRGYRGFTDELSYQSRQSHSQRYPQQGSDHV